MTEKHREDALTMRKNLIFVVLSAALLLTGCGADKQADAQNHGQEQVGTGVVDENRIDVPDVDTDMDVDVDTDVDVNVDTDMDIDVYAEGDGGFRELTQEELDTFTQFIRKADTYGFLLSEYTNPIEVDLGEVFYSGAGLQKDMSEEEVIAYLAACNQEEIYLDCIKIDRGNAEKLVGDKLGLALEDMDADRIGMYIPEFDAYYHECGDTNYLEFTCISGLVNGDVYTLDFKADMDWDYTYSYVQTILEKTENGYCFISNQSLVPPQNSSEGSYGEVTDVRNAWECLKDVYFPECELEEIIYDEESDEFEVVISRSEMEFGDEDEARPCESIVFLDEVDEDYYIFGYYNVFYDGDAVYATQTRGWYQVDRHTGEASVL